MTEIPVDANVIAKIQKLLNLAANNTNPEEAASAASKAQELMTSYNLSNATIERASGIVNGKREELKVQGGFYQYQRDLWEAVARLHFCLYWTQEYATERTKKIIRRGVTYHKGDRVIKKRHALVGRVVNTTAASILAQYLETSVEKMIRERLRDDTRVLWGKWGISYREGAVSDLLARIGEKYEDILDQQEREKTAAKEKTTKAGRPKEGMGTAITLSAYIDAETDANNDFIHGEGWSARQAAERAREAEDYRKRQETYTRWAAAHPEEAAARAEEARKAARRHRGGYGRQSYADSKTRDHSAFYSGRDDAKAIGLDRQTGDGRNTKRIAKS